MDSPDLTEFARALLGVEGEPERVLEIGCGEGEAVLFLAREFPRSRVRGLDRDAAAVAAAAGKVGLDPEGRVAFKSGDPRRLPFPDSHFDLVVQRGGSPAAAEIARVARPGSWLLIAAGARSPGLAGLLGRTAEPALAKRGFSPVPADEGGKFLLMRRAGAAAPLPPD